VAVVGSTEGNRHELGAQCVRLLLERRGWRVFYLGGDLPIEECAAAQRVRRAGLVGLSFAPPHTAADMQRCLRLLGEFTDPGRPYALALGGDLGEPPELDDLARPFREVGVFGSLGAFGSALERGFGSA
jgi:methanogenic corrinoid protein MtbC1